MKTALVTGASAGIGRELVRQLVRDRGMTVLATARRLDRLHELAAELPEGSVHVLDGDLADSAFRARLWDHAETVFPGGPDLLINNAGLGNYAEFASQDQAAWQSIIDVNIIALMDLTQKAANRMKARGSGQIVQISSILGFVGIPYSAVYVASKHFVNGLVKSLRYELRGSGVRVWAACPGRTESEFASAALGRRGEKGRDAKGTPTDRVVRRIVNQIDGRKRFLIPDFGPSVMVAIAHWLPAPFEWVMQRWSPAYFRREVEAAGGRLQKTTGGDP